MTQEERQGIERAMQALAESKYREAGLVLGALLVADSRASGDRAVKAAAGRVYSKAKRAQVSSLERQISGLKAQLKGLRRG